MKLISGQGQKFHKNLHDSQASFLANKSSLKPEHSSNQNIYPKMPLLQGKGRKSLLQIMGKPGQPVQGDHKVKAKYMANALMPSQSRRALQAKKEKSMKIGYGGFVAPVQEVAKFLNQKLIMIKNDQLKMERSDAFMRKSSSRIGNFWNQSQNNPYKSQDNVRKIAIHKGKGRKSQKSFNKNQSHDLMYQKAGKKLRLLFQQHTNI